MLPRDGSNSSSYLFLDSYEPQGWFSQEVFAQLGNTRKIQLCDTHELARTTNHFVGLKAHSTRKKSCLKETQPVSQDYCGQGKSTTPTLLDKHNLYYILYLMLLSTDQCSQHPSPKKVLLFGSGDHLKNSPKKAIQRSRDQEDTRCIYTTALLSIAQGGSWDRGKEDCKSWNTRKSVEHGFSQKGLHEQDWNNDNINRLQKGFNHHEVISLDRQLMAAERRGGLSQR